MEKLMLEIMKKIGQMARVNIIGQMEIIIKELFLMVFVMETGILSKENQLYNIGDNIKMIKSVDLVKLITGIILFTSETLRIIIGMAMDSYLKDKKVNTKDIGSTIIKLMTKIS